MIQTALYLTSIYVDSNIPIVLLIAIDSCRPQSQSHSERLISQHGGIYCLEVKLAASSSLSSQQLVVEGEASPAATCLTSYSSETINITFQGFCVLTERLASASMNGHLTISDADVIIRKGVPQSLVCRWKIS